MAVVVVVTMVMMVLGWQQRAEVAVTVIDGGDGATVVDAENGDG